LILATCTAPPSELEAELELQVSIKLLGNGPLVVVCRGAACKTLPSKPRHVVYEAIGAQHGADATMVYGRTFKLSAKLVRPGQRGGGGEGGQDVHYVGWKVEDMLSWTVEERLSLESGQDRLSWKMDKLSWKVDR
jgi:hypothetical protein